MSSSNFKDFFGLSHNLEVKKIDNDKKLKVFANKRQTGLIGFGSLAVFSSIYFYLNPPFRGDEKYRLKLLFIPRV